MAKILHKNMKFIVKNKYQTDKLLVYTPLFILHFDPFINALLKKKLKKTLDRINNISCDLGLFIKDEITKQNM